MKSKIILFPLIVALAMPLDAGGFLCQYYPHHTPNPDIILGAPLPLLYNDGISAYDNLKLAVDEINDGGGVDVGGTTYNFKLEVLDTNDLNPTVPSTDVVAVVENLITDKSAYFIIGGPLRSECALATMELVADEEVATIWSAGFLSPAFGTTVAGNYDKYKYCFRTQGRSTELVNETVSILDAIAAAQNWSSPKAYIMVQDVAHAKAAGDALNATLPGHGWTITGYVKIPPGTAAFETPLLTANSTGAQVLIPWFDMPESWNLVNTWYDYQLPMLPIGMVVPAHDSKAWEVFGGKCEYLVNIYPKAGITPINSYASDYIDLYKAEINSAGPGLTWVAPTSYQAVYILKDALERAGSLDDDDVIAALEATNMTGVYGKIAFDANHEMICSTDPSTGAITTWVQWIDGERVAVYPDAVKTANVVLPPWGVNP